GENDLREFRTRLERAGGSLSLVHHVLTDVRCFFRWCESSGLIERAPVPKRWLPRLPERPPDRLTDEEIRAVCGVPEPYGFFGRPSASLAAQFGPGYTALREIVRRGNHGGTPADGGKGAERFGDKPAHLPAHPTRNRACRNQASR